MSVGYTIRNGFFNHLSKKKKKPEIYSYHVHKTTKVVQLILEAFMRSLIVGCEVCSI